MAVNLHVIRGKLSSGWKLASWQRDQIGVKIREGGDWTVFMHKLRAHLCSAVNTATFINFTRICASSGKTINMREMEQYHQKLWSWHAQKFKHLFDDSSPRSRDKWLLLKSCGDRT